MNGLTDFASTRCSRHNDQEMVLDGQFSYEASNQRALPFNVYIEQIEGPLRLYVGANSESEHAFSSQWAGEGALGRGHFHAWLAIHRARRSHRA